MYVVTTAGLMPNPCTSRPINTREKWPLSCASAYRALPSMEKEHITRMQVFRRYRAMNQPICKLKGERACVWVCAWVGAYVCVGVCVGVRGGDDNIER